MDCSPTIGALAAALAKAQATMRAAALDRENPHFRSKYATLASLWDAARGPLSEAGLAVVQTTDAADGATVTVRSYLLHTSGEWIGGAITMRPQQATPQGIGGALTYARRYGFAALVGLTADDDTDGEDGKRETPPTTIPKPAAAPGPPVAPPAASTDPFPEFPAAAAAAAAAEMERVEGKICDLGHALGRDEDTIQAAIAAAKGTGLGKNAPGLDSLNALRAKWYRELNGKRKGEEA